MSFVSAIKSFFIPEKFDFPDFDESGHKRLALSKYTLTGITHEHFDSNPQNVISTLRCDEQVLLHTDPQNKHDKNAVYVTNLNNRFIGWLPSGNSDIFNRLTNGETVFGRVSRLWSFDPNSDEAYEKKNAKLRPFIKMCEIEVAKYSKSVSKKK